VHASATWRQRVRDRKTNVATRASKKYTAFIKQNLPETASVLHRWLNGQITRIRLRVSRSIEDKPSRVEGVMKTSSKAASVDKRKTTGTLFVCNINPKAKVVYLVGEFNNWNPYADRMIRRKGAFQKTLNLDPGEYQYKFLVDEEWHSDPSTEQVPNEFGTTNSIVRV
jgi:hypothetical protein